MSLAPRLGLGIALEHTCTCSPHVMKGPGLRLGLEPGLSWKNGKVPQLGLWEIHQKSGKAPVLSWSGPTPGLSRVLYPLGVPPSRYGRQGRPGGGPRIFENSPKIGKMSQGHGTWTNVFPWTRPFRGGMACPGGYRGTPRTRLVPVLMYAICGLDQFLPELVGDSPTKFNHLQGENHWADLDGVKCGGLVWSPSTRSTRSRAPGAPLAPSSGRQS